VDTTTLPISLKIRTSTTALNSKALGAVHNRLGSIGVKVFSGSVQTAAGLVLSPSQSNPTATAMRKQIRNHRQHGVSDATHTQHVSSPCSERVVGNIQGFLAERASVSRGPNRNTMLAVKRMPFCGFTTPDEPINFVRR
jgi:hypothetical protein